MIDMKVAQKEPERLARALASRHSTLDVREFLALDASRRAILAEVEALKGERNAASAEVGRLKREGKDSSPMFAALAQLSDRISELDNRAARARADVEAWLLSVPNIPAESVPVGKDESENVEVYRWGTPGGAVTPAHDKIGTDLGGLDFERAARMTGSRFVILMGWAARLDRALANFFLNEHIRCGYTEVNPPFMVNRKAMTGTGQLPKFEEDLFHINDWDYFLIPTAEVPLTNLHADEILGESRLPLAYCACTPCFRSEAGAAGKDTRGLIRMHQFTKVEMVRFAHPDDSYNQLELMKTHAQALLEKLELPYRVIELCTGDLGFGAAKTYDLEVWLPAQQTYREISSCSNCGDFQARRANIKFRPANGGKPLFAHTLNGSGLPTGRTMAALLENGLQKNGAVRLPEVLWPYMGGLKEIAPAE